MRAPTAGLDPDRRVVPPMATPITES
jgi:hypothetical protein